MTDLLAGLIPHSQNSEPSSAQLGARDRQNCQYELLQYVLSAFFAGGQKIVKGWESGPRCSDFSDFRPQRFQVRVVQRLQLNLFGVADLKSALQPFPGLP